MRTAPLVDLLSSCAADRPALSDAESTIDHVALCNAGDAIAASLVARGVSPGERVAVALPDGALAVAAFVGTALARATFTPLRFEDEPALRARLEPLRSHLLLAGARAPQSVRVAAAAVGVPLVTLAFDRNGVVLVDGDPVYEAHGRAPQPDDVVFLCVDGSPVTLDAIVTAARAAVPAGAETLRPSAPLCELRGLVETLAILSAGGHVTFPGASGNAAA
jgi:acyl-CoA synthetase (AMP-forming)/AMP-acid ligase II